MKNFFKRVWEDIKNAFWDQLPYLLYSFMFFLAVFFWFVVFFNWYLKKYLPL
tara:strand:- start:263 stop:418 length:156 start_codon:yes stop_codon:yes gene_type:complete